MPINSTVQAQGNSQLANLQGLLNLFLGIAQGNSNVSSAAFNQFLSGQGPFASQYFGQNFSQDALDQLANFRANYQNPLTNLQLSPEISQMLSGLKQPMGTLQTLIANNGQTADTQSLRDFLNTFINGQTGPQSALAQTASSLGAFGGFNGPMASALEGAQSLTNFGGNTQSTYDLQNKGRDILAANGYGPETQGALDFFSKIMANGGRDAGTQNLTSTGQNLVNSGGFTPQMSSILSQLQGIIGQNGMTPQASQLFGKVMDIVNSGGQGGALLPMNQVVSQARDQAATANSQAGEAILRQFAQRTGGAVGSGNAASLLGDFYDKGAQGEASAIRDASQKQQGLQLQQLLGALGAGTDLTKSAQGLLGNAISGAGDLTKAAASNIGTGADLMKAAESLAATRTGQAISGFQDTVGNTINHLKIGGDMLGQGQSLANQRFDTGLNSILGLNQLASTRQNNSASILNNIANSQLNGAQALTGLTGLEFQNQGDALRNLASLTGLGNTIYAGQQNAALASNAQQIDAFLKSMGISSDISNGFTNQFFNASNGLTNIAQLYAQLTGGALNGYSNMGTNFLSDLTQMANKPGFWTQFAGNLLNAGIGAATGGLGSLISGGLKGMTSGRGGLGGWNSSLGGE